MQPSLPGETAVASSGVSRPTRWQCYRWQGSKIPPDWERRELHGATPPLLVTEWSRKPASMRVRSYSHPEQAVEWLRSQVEEYTDQMRPEDPERLGRLLSYLDHEDTEEPELIHRCAYGPCDVLCLISRHGKIVHWQQYLATGAIVWAIVPYHQLVT